MTTIIELPPEANPLNPQFLFKTLQAAASSDQQQIQTAAQQLQNWEKQRGYYSLLQVRSLSACYLFCLTHFRL